MFRTIIKYFFYIFGGVYLFASIAGMVSGKSEAVLYCLIMGIFFCLAGYYFSNKERKEKEEKEKFDKWYND